MALLLSSTEAAIVAFALLPSVLLAQPNVLYICIVYARHQQYIHVEEPRSARVERSPIGCQSTLCACLFSMHLFSRYLIVSMVYLFVGQRVFARSIF